MAPSPRWSPLLLLALVGCVSDPDAVGSEQQAVVYGEDDRTEVFAHPDPFWRTLADQSIVALVDVAAMDLSDPTNVQLRSRPLVETRALCPSEQFLTQPTAADCSGTLIDYDLVLTAGHCIRTERDCSTTRFVFNYFYESEGTLATIDATDDVYACSEIVAREDDGAVDYAVVRLDRTVTDAHQPAAVREGDTPLPLGEPLVVLGYGSGIPLKIDDGGQVINPRPAIRDWFGANLDTFGGNSGSGVFNDEGEVVGILVRGEGDYEYSMGCGRVRLLPNLPMEEGVEEDCTYVARAIAGLCAAAPSTLCGGGSCQACRVDDDCAGGFSCIEGSCLSPCDLDFGCAEGEVCAADGFCEPPRGSRCVDGGVQETRCGRPTGPVMDCGDRNFCAEGACHPLPAGDTCADAVDIEPVDQHIVGVFSEGGTSAGRGSCGGRGRDVIYRVVLDGRYRMRAYASAFDAVLHIRTQCGNPASEVACDDDGGARTDSLIQGEFGPGEYFIYMDVFQRQVLGAYELDLMFERIVEADAGVDGGFDAGAGDAGVSDGGVVSPDAGSADAGDMDAAPLFDAGTPDAGAADGGVDAGRGEVKLHKWGCDCRAAGGRGDAPTPLWLALGGVLALRLRRRIR